MNVDLVDMLVERAAAGPVPVLRLIKGPVVTFRARKVELPEGGKRLLAFVALRGGKVDRQHAAGALWPVGSDARASGNLRSALWRLNENGFELLAGDRHVLVLRPDVLVDVHLVTAWSSRLVAGTATAVDVAAPPLGVDAFELLPGWLDDWVLLEREGLRQRVLHALDALSRCHSRAGRHAQAVDVAMAAIAIEPLRESAQRALIEAHLAEGNRVEACRCYEAYRDLAYHELGVEPTAALQALCVSRERPPAVVPAPRAKGGPRAGAAHVPMLTVARVS